MTDDQRRAREGLLEEHRDMVGAYLEAVSTGCSLTTLIHMKKLLAETSASVGAVLSLLCAGAVESWTGSPPEF